MSSRDLFAASRDLLVNIKDFLVICDPTKVISINNHHLHPINSPHGEEVGNFWPLTYLLTWLILSSLYLISCLFGGKTPTAGAHRARHVFFFREMMILRWSEA